MTVMPSFDYSVSVLRVIDGDTVDLLVDLGFRLQATLRFRLLGVDTPERDEPGWSDASLFTATWLKERAGTLRARTYKADSFGRWLADVYAEASPTRSADYLNDALLRTGHASAVTR